MVEHPINIKDKVQSFTHLNDVCVIATQRNIFVYDLLKSEEPLIVPTSGLFIRKPENLQVSIFKNGQILAHTSSQVGLIQLRKTRPPKLTVIQDESHSRLNRIQDVFPISDTEFGLIRGRSLVRIPYEQVQKQDKWMWATIKAPPGLSNNEARTLEPYIHSVHAYPDGTYSLVYESQMILSKIQARENASPALTHIKTLASGQSIHTAQHSASKQVFYCVFSKNGSLPKTGIYHPENGLIELPTLNPNGLVPWSVIRPYWHGEIPCYVSDMAKVQAFSLENNQWVEHIQLDHPTVHTSRQSQGLMLYVEEKKNGRIVRKIIEPNPPPNNYASPTNYLDI